MSVGPMGGFVASFAGTSLAQTKGSEVERAQHDSNQKHLRDASSQKAEAAAGIGETDGEDHAAAERDADGRRAWEQAAQPQGGDNRPAPPATPCSKDASGESGGLLDLTG